MTVFNTASNWASVSHIQSSVAKAFSLRYNFLFYKKLEQTVFGFVLQRMTLESLFVDLIPDIYVS